jgi:hypothetical protein
MLISWLGLGGGGGVSRVGTPLGGWGVDNPKLSAQSRRPCNTVDRCAVDLKGLRTGVLEDSRPFGRSFCNLLGQPLRPEPSGVLMLPSQSRNVESIISGHLDGLREAIWDQI